MNFSEKNLQKIFGGQFSGCNHVTLLWKSGESFRSIFEAVKKAKELICLEFYIFRNDETGTELAEILRQKVSEGVKVYMLYDHFGSFGTPLKFWKYLKEAGIQVRASRPFKWTAPFHYVHRDHRKLIIIDGKSAFTGGLNIANEYRGYHVIKKKRVGEIPAYSSKARLQKYCWIHSRRAGMYGKASRSISIGM